MIKLIADSGNFENAPNTCSKYLQLLQAITYLERWRSWFRHCATRRKVAGSISHSVIGIFYWHKSSVRTPTEMSTRDILGGKGGRWVGLIFLPTVLKFGSLKFLEHSGTFQAWYRDCCTKTYTDGLIQTEFAEYYRYRGADKSLARPTSLCILFDGENISFDASLVIYINSTNIPPIMIINKIYEDQNLLSL